ncbi:mycothiol system anti-sigma-R factor [Actinobacteria bacterium YIM 96077]|uniref:Mycothiol system anti-sigma-R factor n=1 Tax=Phytoactinopolyspora halophila TaxID=1981511 RepID=A0A329R2L6_9ACTN|nr:mycothiol system anti-sigma-R factor [Phytoactinopolyspora halophila]AYY11984.1 mycothiol system anti-sigma-R factor [Actinobacteria bacterium YIM 96077]RAW18781.1 mycothiol system anti-sigma-R factor [Phytoactinopolyspora halophila]
MSCDDDDVDCAEVLDRVYAFLDREMDSDGTLTYEEIEAHLHDCGGCLSKYDLERAIRALVARSCGCDHAPDELRMKVLTRIREARVQASDW